MGREIVPGAPILMSSYRTPPGERKKLESVIAAAMAGQGFPTDDLISPSHNPRGRSASP